MLSPQEIVLILTTLGALALILSNRISADVVALLVLLTLAFTGVIATDTALSGFSSSVVITIIGLFVISRALEETGIIYRVAKVLNRLGRGSEIRLILIFMSAGAALSLVMNNIAAGAVLLPAAVRVARISNVHLSRLLIPLSFGTLVGGMATYLTTANIVLSDILIHQGLDGLAMRDFIVTGGPIVVVAVLYMLTIGRRLLPVRESMSQHIGVTNLYESYGLGDHLREVQVLADSQLASRTLRESKIRQQLGLTVTAIWRGHEAILAPSPDQLIEAGDVLLVLGRLERFGQLLAWGTAFRESSANNRQNYEVELTEILIAPRSHAVGKTLTGLDFRAKYGLTAVAMWREGRGYRTDVGKYTLQEGDALLMVGTQEQIKQLGRDRDYLVLGSSDTARPKNMGKARPALTITFVVLMLAIFDLLPLPVVMLGGMAALIITGCLNAEEAYQAIEWRVVFLIAGMLPMSIALRDTGLAARIGTGLIDLSVSLGPLGVVAVLFVLATGVTQIFGGQVTALIVGPIAVSAARQLGIHPQAVAVSVAIGCSTAFLTPISHPVNVLMMGPGGYRFNDFFKAGLGMTIVTFIVLLMTMVFVWGI